MPNPSPLVWRIRDRALALDRPHVMGIVNVTPDSFSDGGNYLDPGRAIDHALQLVAQGADILDVGGESTRPGASPVDVAEELRRVLPVLTALARRSRVPISIDTMKPAVAAASLDAGAGIVNDVNGLADSEMVEVVRTRQAGAVVMHMQGTPRDMQIDPQYGDVVGEVSAFFESRLQELAEAGIAPKCIAIDPGIGFGKRVEHNWQLIAGLAEFQRFRRPVVLGVSRKRFLGADVPPTERIAAGLAIAKQVTTAGTAQVIRTHDVAATVAALRQANVEKFSN